MPQHRLPCLLFYLLVPNIFCMYQQQRTSAQRNQPALVGYDIPQPPDIFMIPPGVQLQPGMTCQVGNDNNYLINMMPNGGMMVLRNGQFWEKSVGGGIYHKDLNGNPYKKGPDGKFYPLNLPPAPQQFHSVHNQVQQMTQQHQHHQHQHQNQQQPAGGNVGPPPLRSHSISQQQRLATAGIRLPTGIFNVPDGIQYGVTQKVNNDDNYLINVMPNGDGMMVLRNNQFWEKSVNGGIYHKDLNGIPYKMGPDGKFYPLNLGTVPSQQIQARPPTLSASKMFGNAHGVAGQTKFSQGTSSNAQQQRQTTPVATIPIGVHTVQPTINNNFKTGRLSTTQIAQQRQTSTLRNKTIANTIAQNGTTCRGKFVQFAATVGTETFRRFDDNNEASTSRSAICRFGSYITRSQAYDYLRTFVKYFKPPFDEDYQKVMADMNREQSVQFIGDYRGGFLWPVWMTENQIFQHLRAEFCYLDDCAQLKSDSKNAIYAWTLFSLAADMFKSMKNENPWACVHHADCMMEDNKIMDMLTLNRKYSIGELKRNCQKVADKIKESLSSKKIQQHLTKRNPAMYHCKNILTPNPKW